MAEIVRTSNSVVLVAVLEVGGMPPSSPTSQPVGVAESVTDVAPAEIDPLAVVQPVLVLPSRSSLPEFITQRPGSVERMTIPPPTNELSTDSMILRVWVLVAAVGFICSVPSMSTFFLEERVWVAAGSNCRVAPALTVTESTVVSMSSTIGTVPSMTALELAPGTTPPVQEEGLDQGRPGG